MDTLPTPLDGLSTDGLGDFRISDALEIAAMLRKLADANVPLNLNASDGTVVSTTLWALDNARGTLSFSTDGDDPRLPALLECDEAVVVGYLDSVKLQFDVQNLLLVHGTTGSVLRAPIPREMFRFQRRNAYRVRPATRHAPTARVRHPEIADMALALRVLDVSIGGCALFLPDDVPPLQPGVLMNQVQIELDIDTRMTVKLRLQHVTSINPDSRGVRLGCELVDPSGDTLRVLQRYIDQTQKKRRLLSLD
jgi:c-di-GMP-binding flagellar brake protein YcgR